MGGATCHEKRNHGLPVALGKKSSNGAQLCRTLLRVEDCAWPLCWQLTRRSRLADDKIIASYFRTSLQASKQQEIKILTRILNIIIIDVTAKSIEIEIKYTHSQHRTTFYYLLYTTSLPGPTYYSSVAPSAGVPSFSDFCNHSSADHIAFPCCNLVSAFAMLHLRTRPNISAPSILSMAAWASSSSSKSTKPKPRCLSKENEKKEQTLR